MAMLFSIVIPCYNEEENIPLILKGFSDAIGEREDIEVILVDNGSTDNSAEVMDKLLPLYPFSRRVTVKVNQGYGYGICTGLKSARGDFLGWTHADMQTDPSDVVKAVDIIRKNGCGDDLFVKGRRRGRSAFDMIFTNGMSAFETVLMGERLVDINAQPNMFSRAFYNKWEEPPNDFSLDLYAFFLARRNKCNVIRFDVLFPERIHGESKWNTGLGSKWKFIKRTVDYSLKLKKKLKK